MLAVGGALAPALAPGGLLELRGRLHGVLDLAPGDPEPSVGGGGSDLLGERVTLGHLELPHCERRLDGLASREVRVGVREGYILLDGLERNNASNVPIVACLCLAQVVRVQRQ
eukprot:8884919-Pyramimonas_sp.AAC.1